METFFDKIGGRKFVMGIVLIVAGGAVDVLSPNGLSVNLLGLMTAIYAAFSATNAIVTNKQLDNEGKNPPPADDAVKKLANELLPVLDHIGNGMKTLNDQQAAQGEALRLQSQSISAMLKK